MRDVQVSIADYFRHSTGFGIDAETLATPVRTAVAFIQVLNDVLSNDFTEQVKYKAMFEQPHDSRVELILAFQYVRNVGQHLLHPVRPGPGQTVVGGTGLGFRTFAFWDEIPRAVHDRLRRRTQALKVHYDARLLGNEVTGTLLDAARFFWEVCPDAVHRQPNGEWTGFPLRHQAGVRSRLHPEEPEDQAAAIRWMLKRKPGGDLRVVCGCLREPKRAVVVGLTFSLGCAFTPFFERPEQVRSDMALGFPYHEGDVEENTRECDLGCGFSSTLCSKGALDGWIGDPIRAPRADVEWTTVGSADLWRAQMMLEDEDNPQSFLTRRERRLNAWFPIR